MKVLSHSKISTPYVLKLWLQTMKLKKKYVKKIGFKEYKLKKTKYIFFTVSTFTHGHWFIKVFLKLALHAEIKVRQSVE